MTVIRQQDFARTRVPPGTAVGFVLGSPLDDSARPDRGGRGGVSQPPVKMATVPDLFGASEEQARDLLGAAGLRVGEVTRVLSAARPRHRVRAGLPPGRRG